WKSRSRACFAEPPAESPSTRNNSPREGSCDEQSVNLPGNGGPWVTFLRTTFLLARMRRWALLIHTSASCSASSVCSFSHRLNASFATPETNAAHCRDESRSLV